MPGSQTTPGPTGARNNAPADFAFHRVNNVGTRIANTFAAQWLAYTLPYRRFADALTDACARIGGEVDSYSFIAVDFHHILLAGLPAHSLALRPAHSRGHQFVTHYPKASDISSPPCLLRLLPAGANRRVGLAPTGKRRLVTAHPHCGHCVEPVAASQWGGNATFGAKTASISMRPDAIAVTASAIDNGLGLAQRIEDLSSSGSPRRCAISVSRRCSKLEPSATWLNNILTVGVGERLPGK